MATQPLPTCDDLAIANGRSRPALFGDSASPILLFLAARPRSRWSEICRFVGRSGASTHGALRRLMTSGLVWGDRRYWLNPTLKRSRELELLLRQMAVDFGIPLRPFARSVNTKSPQADDIVAFKSLFRSEKRTTLLLATIVLGEAYPREFAGLVPGMMRDICAGFRGFEELGVLVSRRVKNMKLYRFNVDSPYARLLLRLLKRLAIDRHDVKEIANAIYVMRSKRRFYSSVPRLRLYDVELKLHKPVKSINGVRREQNAMVDSNRPLHFSGLGGSRESTAVRRLRRKWKLLRIDREARKISVRRAA